MVNHHWHTGGYYYYFYPGTQFPGNENITLCNTKKLQKSSWNEPYSSSSFTKQSFSKMGIVSLNQNGESLK